MHQVLRANTAVAQTAPPSRLRPNMHPVIGNQAHLRLQTKLEIGAVDDPLEHEADRAAEQVMRMPDTAFAGNCAVAPLIQRKCERCEDEDKIARKESTGGVVNSGPAPDSVRAALSSAGRPLDAGTRAFFEPRFGADFSGVRLHDDAQAAQSAQAIGARAYTYGQDIAFAAGRLAPDTASGRALLAHELAHVVQQTAKRDAALRRACGPAAIGQPTGCERADKTFVSGDVFRFSVNCDDWSNGADAGLLDTIQMIPADSQIEIHGYASAEGPEGFNESLACARALKAKSLILASGYLPASRIARVLDHGATPGAAADRRSVVLHRLDAPKPADPPKTDPAKSEEKQPETKDQKTEKTDPPIDATHVVPDKTEPPDEHPRLVIQIPVTPVNVQIPFKGSAGVDVKPSGGGRSTALDQAFQPNVAIGLNYSFQPKDEGFQLGLFGQAGVNAPLSLGNARPQTPAGTHTSNTGTNLQGYVQVAWVFYSKNGKSVSLLFQPGIGKTFDSAVSGVDGLGVTVQGGIQFTKDIIQNKLQLFGTIMVGGTRTTLDQPPAGDPNSPSWQPFTAFQIGLQPLITVVKYPDQKPDEK